MKAIFTTLFSLFLFMPQWGLAKVNPAQSMAELEAQAGEPGNENGLSVMTNSEGLGKLHIGLEPYLPQVNKFGLNSEEEGIYIRQAESQSGTSSDRGSSTEDATER